MIPKLLPVCLLPACAALAFVAFPALAQPTPASGAKFDKHDFDGTWDRYPVAGDKHLDSTVAPPPQDVPEPPLKPQYIDAYRAQLKATAAAFARGEPPVTNYVKCLPDGMPTMMQGMFPMEVLQSRGQITIIQEAYNQVRRIYLNEKQIAIEDAEPAFWGHSVGRWDGDTLVVDTVGVKENVRFKNAPHSDQMRISERIKVLAPDYFEDRVTITDPVYLTAPWSWTWMYKRKPGYKINEYVCEDNREFPDPANGTQRLRLLGGG
jgi:hypothetical protein